ncbi:MAG: GNAT family N-acetyltransferase [Clostridia bacterium]|nr:GNAT family N-acetyltransferase [Clostridia bacterium]
MIRKLTNEDYHMVMDYLLEEPSINLFIIGDIENFGFHHPKQDVWGSFNPELEGVLLRYKDNFIPYYKKDDFNIEHFKSIIKMHPSRTMISGKSSVLEGFRDTFEKSEYREMFFCELNEKDDHLQVHHDVKIANVGDAERIFELLSHIEEFSNFGTSPKDIQERIAEKTGRIYYIEDEKHKMVSVSQTSAENKHAAMVVGVATLPESRGRGYMSSCLSQLCLDLLNENKRLCLFYDNPEAGSVYHRMGFKSIKMGYANGINS